MLLKLYSVYDSKSEAYSQPMMYRSNGEAIRAFSQTCNDGKSSFYNYPADFTLFELGSWDDGSAAFDILPTPKSLGLAIDFKALPN